MSESEKTLLYSITEKGPVQVVSFGGRLTNESETILTRCVHDVLERSAQWVVLNFQGVSQEVDRRAFRHLVQLQRSIRDHQKQLRISNVGSGLAELLLSHAVVRKDELSENVADALSSFQNSPSQVARVFSSDSRARKVRAR